MWSFLLLKTPKEFQEVKFQMFCLKAKNKADYSAVIEIKAKGTQKVVEDAMKQIENKAYVQELVSEGYTRILKVSLAVDGKDIEAMVEKG